MGATRADNLTVESDPLPDGGLRPHRILARSPDESRDRVRAREQTDQSACYRDGLERRGFGQQLDVADGMGRCELDGLVVDNGRCSSADPSRASTPRRSNEGMRVLARSRRGTSTPIAQGFRASTARDDPPFSVPRHKSAGSAARVARHSRSLLHALELVLPEGEGVARSGLRRRILAVLRQVQRHLQTRLVA